MAIDNKKMEKPTQFELNAGNHEAHMHREGGVQGNLSPRRQKGYCCFSLLRDFRAGPLTHSPCQGGINDPKQLPLGIPTHQNIFVTYMILRILFSYTNTSTLLLCAKPVKSSLSKSLNMTTNLPCNQWTDEKA